MASTSVPPLRVQDSLKRARVDFVTGHGRRCSWYQCGPTVYAESHLGHARSYVSQDYIRRILRDYFGYDVHFVMNITDIDDKIILRARQNYLVAQLVGRHTELTQGLIDHVEAAWSAYFAAKLAPIVGGPLSPLDWPAVVERVSAPGKASEDARMQWRQKDEKFEMHYDALLASRRALERASEALRAGQNDSSSVSDLITSSDGIVALAEDKEHAATVTDHSIFRQLAQRFEASFFDDMDSLNVERPSVLTRVSEYVEEIIAFTQGIVENGYAYTDSGDVYFDTKAFDGAQAKGKGRESDCFAHTYAKLKPESKGHQTLLDEGEGALSGKGRKRHPADFALWKASKAGEPSWPSPWGAGRPGWHIECSAMAGHVLGEQLDVHAGGADLAFPHHDNEIAQSEAYYDCRAWVRYFLHTGHLHINGLKMSKSLKNFTTIEDALKLYSARQLRLLFLMHDWHEGMDYSEATMSTTKAIEEEFEKFFRNVEALFAEEQAVGAPGPSQYSQNERELMAQLASAQDGVDAALRDSFDTPKSILLLRRLITSANAYLSTTRGNANLSIVKAVSAWVTKILDVFGLTADSRRDGWRGVGWSQRSGGAETSQDTLALARALSNFRDDVRSLASSTSNDSSSLTSLLQRCDRLRDDDLIELGVQLEDREGAPALVKLVDAGTLRRERDERQAALDRTAAKSRAQAEAAEAKAKAKRDQAGVEPSAIFTPDKYGPQRDEAGMPTHDAQGVELSKSAKKKAIKDYERQKQLYERYTSAS